MEFAKTGSTDITTYAWIWYPVNCKQLKDISLLKIPERLPPDFTFLFSYRKRGFASPGAELLGGLANNNGIVFIMASRPHELQRKFLMRN